MTNIRPFAPDAAAGLAIFLSILPCDTFAFLNGRQRPQQLSVNPPAYAPNILPSHTNYGSVIHALHSNDAGELSSQETIISPSSWYDPAEAFNSEAPPSDLTVMEETLFSGEKCVNVRCLDSMDDDQAVDIMRDLEGYPLSTGYFEEKMGIKHVERYSCPETDAFRGFMSNGCRVQLFPGGQTAFYKRIAFENLDHAREKLEQAPFKLLRDIKSYQVVASFLSSAACKQLVERTGVEVPKCYDAQLEPDNVDPMKSKFSFLLQDFSPKDGWYQEWLLATEDESKAALSSYAKIHAFFWDGSAFWNDKDAANELERGVWKSGSYVQPQAQSPNQCKIVAEQWAKKKLKFQNELSSFDFWDNLGERLQIVAEECGREAHPFADDVLFEKYRKYRTFTHGDPKQANLFFRRSADSELQVGLIDFQWSGFGLAATDVAHFLTSAVHADILKDGGEDNLLRYYFDELQEYLVEFGAFSTIQCANEDFSFETFMEQYETAVLDLVRLVIAYTWSRFEEAVEIGDEKGCARTMNKTSYNKSLPNVVWLMSRCDKILKSRGV